MGRLIKYLFYLALVAAVGIAGYALVSDLPPPENEVIIDVTPPPE
ncbi:hypothetical protein [Algicella marina]|nr:hypothetical protein [Algicella marina]